MCSALNEEANTNQIFVAMPWEDRTILILSQNDSFGHMTSCNRWELIMQKLHSSTIILNCESLINAIKSYNVIIEKNGKQTLCPWKFMVLKQYFSNLNNNDYSRFFQVGGVLSTIRSLALQLQDLVPSLKLLKIGINSSVTLNQLQVASILANAFFCTFPKGKGDCPSINFNTLYENGSNTVVNYNIEKIKCIMHYFFRLHQKQPTGNLSFHRLCIPDHKFPRWDKTTVHLCSLVLDNVGKIEDQEGYLQMDFANRYIGGGVLGRGCVQEEIRFIICPELIVSRLFTERITENEALFVIGAERYCRYTGYSNTFKFDGDYQDLTPLDENGHRQTYLIALDALYFNRFSEQFRESKILRELKKAYVGFRPLENADPLPLATGNWGCGAFGGDPQLKSIIQLMAASQAKRKMLYLTFGDVVLKNQLEELYQLLTEREINVGMLYRIIRLYNRERRKNQSVFEFVKESIFKMEKKKTVKNSPKPISQKFYSSPFEFNAESSHKISLMEEAATQLLETKIDSDSKQYFEFPEMDINFENLDKDIQKQINDVSQNRNSCQLQQMEADNSLSSDDPSTMDIIWFENETYGLKKKIEKQQLTENKCKKETIGSPSLFSDDEQIVDFKNSPVKKNKIDDGFGDSFSSTNDANRKAQDFIGKDKSVKDEKKLLQKKITDCFSKK